MGLHWQEESSDQSTIPLLLRAPPSRKSFTHKHVMCSFHKPTVCPSPFLVRGQSKLPATGALQYGVLIPGEKIEDHPSNTWTQFQLKVWTGQVSKKVKPNHKRLISFCISLHWPLNCSQYASSSDSRRMHSETRPRDDDSKAEVTNFDCPGQACYRLCRLCNQAMPTPG